MRLMTWQRLVRGRCGVCRLVLPGVRPSSAASSCTNTCVKTRVKLGVMLGAMVGVKTGVPLCRQTARSDLLLLGKVVSWY